MAQGFIYILTNEAMPGIVKVGKTRGEPMSRAVQLSSATGVPVRFSVFRQYAVTNCHDAEGFSHRVLERVFGRPNARREFFSASPEAVAALLDEALASLLVRDDSLIADVAFVGPVLRLERKEFSFAKLEFEELFRAHAITEEKIAASASLQRVAGAYLATCFARGEAPNHRCVLTPRVKAPVLEIAIAFAKEFEDDPVLALIEFVRKHE